MTGEAQEAAVVIVAIFRLVVVLCVEALVAIVTIFLLVAVLRAEAFVDEAAAVIVAVMAIVVVAEEPAHPLAYKNG